MEDIRYSELLFLRAIASRTLEWVSGVDPSQAERLGLDSQIYIEMVIALLEDLYIQFDDHQDQLLVLRLRREAGERVKRPFIADHDWDDARSALHRMLRTARTQRVRVTFRGLRRIDELQALLRYDRILDDFGVLLSMRYFNADLDHALQRSNDLAVSVLYADMDDFGPINKRFGQAAGDVVMRKYLETIRACVGDLGTAFRGVGDEVAVLVLGQGHERVVDMAETVRSRVAGLECIHKEIALPRVTASIGVASTPPEERTRNLVDAAEERKRRAKESGKNQVNAG